MTSYFKETPLPHHPSNPKHRLHRYERHFLLCGSVPGPGDHPVCHWRHQRSSVRAADRHQLTKSVNVIFLLIVSCMIVGYIMTLIWNSYGGRARVAFSDRSCHLV